MSKLIFIEKTWEDYLYWQKTDIKMLIFLLKISYT